MPLDFTIYHNADFDCRVVKKVIIQTCHTDTADTEKIMWRKMVSCALVVKKAVVSNLRHIVLSVSLCGKISYE